MPPAGMLDRIRHKARRRKRNQALMAAAGCAVVVAAAVSVPQIATALHSPPAGRPVASALPPTAKKLPSAPGGGSNTSAPEATHATLMPPQHIRLVSRSGRQRPGTGHFRPTSVTFAGTGSGGVVGAVIGQAGPPCCDAVLHVAGPDSRLRLELVRPGRAADLRAGGAARASARCGSRTCSDGWAFGPGAVGDHQRRLAVAAGNHLRPAGHRPGGSRPARIRGLRVLHRYRRRLRQRLHVVLALHLSAGARTWTPVAVPAAFRT